MTRAIIKTLGVALVATLPLLAHAQKIGAPELAVPKKIIRVPEIPVLGTGKTDYVALQRIVETELRRAA